MSHNVTIKEGAFILGDAHYSHSRPQLLTFIKKIHAKELQPTQLIFMGDIFDALFGGVTHTQNENREIVTLIEEISNFIDIIYLEGNHDFNLQAIFSNIQIFKINQQPLLCSYENKKIYLAHGDYDGTLGYKVYTALIRNRGVLYILSQINNLANNYILNRLNSYLELKNDCKELSWFEEFINARSFSNYQCDYFIEGHFHQNKTFKLKTFIYINLAAFACNQRYFVVKSLKDKELLEEKIL